MDQLDRIYNKLDGLDEKVDAIQVELARRDYGRLNRTIDQHGKRLSSLEHYRTKLMAIGAAVAATVSGIITYLTSK